MLWFAVALFMLCYVAIVVLPIMRRRRAAHGREPSSRIAPPLARAELKRQFVLLAAAHREIDVEIAGELVRVGWNLEAEAAEAKAYEKSPYPTYQLELQIGNDADHATVTVRHAVGTINWEPSEEDPARLEPSIEWLWPLEPVSETGSHTTYGEPDIAGETVKERSLGHLVQRVRQIVLDAGYAWQPAIDIVPGAASAAPVAPREAFEPSQATPRNRL
jgi:hypothetical protein